MASNDMVRCSVETILQHEESELMPFLWLKLAQGEPATVEELAKASGWREGKVRQALQGQPGVDWTEDGRVEGFGITLRPTPHRFDFEGRTVYGWCASDVLCLPALLNKPGVVTSSCPATGEPIRVELEPGSVVTVDPPSTVVSAVRPGERVDDVRGEVCGLGHFFSSREAAAGWDEANPEGFVQPVRDDFEAHREILRELGWT